MCRVNHSKLQATSTDLYHGARDAHARIRYDRPSILGTQSRTLPGTARLSQAQPNLESRLQELSDSTACCRTRQRSVAGRSLARFQTYRHRLSSVTQTLSV